MNAIRWESPVKGRLREDRLVIGTSIAAHSQSWRSSALRWTRCGVMVHSTVPPVGRYSVPCTPGSRGEADAPDRRKTGKGMSRLMNAMLASGGYGSVRGAISDGGPYRDNWVAGAHRFRFAFHQIDQRGHAR